MKSGSSSELSGNLRTELDVNLRKIWSLGANVIVGWRFLPAGIKVAYLPSYDLPQVAKTHPNLLRYNRYVESEEEFAALADTGCRVKPLAIFNNYGIDKQSISFVNELVQRYSVTHTECRAVALFDIVSFSLYSPFEQITQINVLSHYIRLAARRCKSLELPVDLSMTTTGDGFYIWNNETGLMADIGMFCVTLLSLAYTNAAQAAASTESVPRLRCCLHIGSHYEYFQATAGRTNDGSFIVGDVTIELARLIGAAHTNQLVIGSFTRDLSDAEPLIRDAIGLPSIDTLAFMALAQGAILKLVDLPIPGGKITDVKAYLTGPQVSENTFTIRKYYVTDKHGLEHPCYNAKFNVTVSGNRQIFFGLLDRDLEKFKGHAGEDSDIEIRVV